MTFDDAYLNILRKINEDMSPFETENYPKGLIFLLPIEDRPSDLPPLPPEMEKMHFWHTGVVYEGHVYETFNHARNKISSSNERLSDPSFKNVVFVSYPINTSKLLSEVDSGTDCATYVGRILGISTTVGYEKDPKIWPDTIYEKLKDEGVRFQKGSEGMKLKKQAVL
ncbi:MAG: hypothetical protein WCP55_03555 [Lentisphaerota bacterium]